MSKKSPNQSPHQPPAAIAWQERAYTSAERVVLTDAQLNIPGLAMLGRHQMQAAIAPLPDHYHEKCFEFTVVLEGSLSFTVHAPEGPKDYVISRGEVFFTRPGEIHSTNHKPLSKGDIFWFQLDFSPEPLHSPESILCLSKAASDDLCERLQRLAGHRLPRLPRQSLERIAQISLEQGGTSTPFALANKIASLLYDCLAQLEQIDNPVPEDIQKVLQYIHFSLQREPSENILLQDLARVARLSVSQLKQKFKVFVGMAPRHYINLQRIEGSKADLLRGLSVTEVAMLHGFSSSSYFVVAFKRYAASTPSEFVKQKALDLPEYLRQ